MRRIIRAAAVGFAIGTALFFVPFVFRFILFALLFGFIMRMVFRPRMYRRHMAKWSAHHAGVYNSQYTQPVPIDGNWYRSPMQQGGVANNIPLK